MVFKPMFLRAGEVACDPRMSFAVSSTGGEGPMGEPNRLEPFHV